jgi:hypothetical protein
MRFGALQSIIDIEVDGILGYRLPQRTHCFQRLGGFPSMLSPAPLQDRVHPLVSFASSSEYVLIVTCPTQVPEQPSGVLLPFATQAYEVHLNDELPTLTYVPPPVFLALSTACSFTYLVSLFHPTATSGIRSSGGFPAAKPARLIDESCPHVVGELHLPASCPAGASSTRFAYRALIRAAIRCSQQAG